MTINQTAEPRSNVTIKSDLNYAKPQGKIICVNAIKKKY